MKYLKTYNESFREEIEELISNIRKKYSNIIDNCLLELKDMSIGDHEEPYWSEDGCYHSIYKIDDGISYEELSNIIKDSVDKLEYNKLECKFKLDHDRMSISGSLFSRSLTELLIMLKPNDIMKLTNMKITLVVTK